MGLIINILITLIGLTIIVIIFYNYIPEIKKLLAEKLKMSLFRKSKDHGILGQIFYQYNHKDSQAWLDWIETQEANVRKDAIELLVKHVDESPSMWGSVTPEAIKTLAQFQEREHMTIMRSILKACKKLWKKYKICESCYEAALIGMVYINSESAKTFLKDEIQELQEESQALSVANTLQEFPEDEDINPLFTQLLVNQNINAKARNYAIQVAQKRSEEQAHIAFIDTVNQMLDLGKPLAEHDIKIFESLMNMVTTNVDEEAFDMLLKACTHKDLYKTSIRSMEFILRSNFDEFNEEQLYSLINIKTDETGILTNTIADINSLTPEEKALCKYDNFENKYPFKKAPVAAENKVNEIECPPCLEKKYDLLMSMIKKNSIDKQNGNRSSIVISGYSDIEKICLARAAASERKWHFIYAAAEDVVASSSTAKLLQETISSNKPCILYLDGIEILLKQLENSYLNQIKTLSSDPLVIVIAALKDEADINEEGLCVLFSQNPDLTELFPNTLEVGRLNESERKTILHEKLSRLRSEYNAKDADNLEILKATDDMTIFELEKYLTKYFRSSILVSKKLIPYSEFEKLESVDFDGRGDL